MSTKIYVGNLSYQTDEAALGSIFEEHGEVLSVRIITDRETGRSKGFGFVEMGDAAAGASAIASLNGYNLDGRQLRVNESENKPRRDNNYRY